MMIIIITRIRWWTGSDENPLDELSGWETIVGYYYLLAF